MNNIKMALGGLVLLAVMSTYALDTTEPFDLGFTDFEMAGNFGGMGLGKGDKELGWKGVIGVGILDNFSASFAYGLSSNEFLAGSGTDEFSLGLFLNSVSTKSFQLDFTVSMASGGALDLGTEINYDIHNIGFQFTASVTMANQGDTGHPNPYKINYHTGFAPQVHYYLTNSMQVLTAVDFLFHHNAQSGSDSFEIGSYALGYNIALNDAIELLTEFAVDIPGSGEELSAGFAVQFISTLPAGK